MTADWQMMTIDEIKASSSSSIAIGPFGSRMKSDRYVEGGNGTVPVIRGNNISDTKALRGEYVYVTVETADELRSSNVFPGDLVFPHRGLIGEVGIVPANQERRYILSTSLMKLTCDTLIADPLFVFYFFRSSLGRHQLMQHASQVGTPGIATPLTSLKSIRLALPTLPEQRAIAHILGALDDKIELNRQMNQTLEQIAAALFTSWFVDFDPVRAKTEGRLPEGMAAETAALFPDRLVESEIGEIPEGWRVCALSDICTTQYGFTASASTEPVGPRFLRVTDINKRNWIEWHSVPFCLATAEERAKYGLKTGDIVVARMADPGKAAMVDEDIDAVFASYLVRLKSPSPPHSLYIFRFLKSDSYLAYAEGAKSGSVQANMNARVIVGAKLTIPNDALLQAFLSIALPLRQRIAANVRESTTLAELRDSLLPRLLSGELRIPSDVLNEEAVQMQTTPEELLLQSRF